MIDYLWLYHTNVWCVCIALLVCVLCQLVHSLSHPRFLFRNLFLWRLVSKKAWRELVKTNLVSFILANWSKNIIGKFLCLGAHAPKAYSSRFVYLCICNSDFSKVTEKQALANAVQAQHYNISNLIVLDF